RMGEDVKNDSLEVPSGVQGIVIDTQKFKRKSHLSEEARTAVKEEANLAKIEFDERLNTELEDTFKEIEKLVGGFPKIRDMGDGKKAEKLSIEEAKRLVSTNLKQLKDYVRATRLELPSKNDIPKKYAEMIRKRVDRIEEIDA